MKRLGMSKIPCAHKRAYYHALMPNQNRLTDTIDDAKRKRDAQQSSEEER